MATCFYDRAFFYRNALFNSNSYLFTKEILNLAKYTNFEWYIKPHPDGHIKNIGSIKSLKKDFPFLKILPKNISNLSFKKIILNVCFHLMVLHYMNLYIWEFHHIVLVKINSPHLILANR